MTKLERLVREIDKFASSTNCLPEVKLVISCQDSDFAIYNDHEVNDGNDDCGTDDGRSQTRTSDGNTSDLLLLLHKQVLTLRSKYFEVSGYFRPEIKFVWDLFCLSVSVSFCLSTSV